MPKIVTFAGIPLYINYKDGKVLDTHEPLLTGHSMVKKHPPQPYTIDLVDRLRMCAGLTPNISIEIQSLLFEAAEELEQLRKKGKHTK